LAKLAFKRENPWTKINKNQTFHFVKNAKGQGERAVQEKCISELFSNNYGNVYGDRVICLFSELCSW